jgi:hypothetical protein
VQVQKQRYSWDFVIGLNRVQEIPCERVLPGVNTTLLLFVDASLSLIQHKDRRQQGRPNSKGAVCMVRGLWK